MTRSDYDAIRNNVESLKHSYRSDSEIVKVLDDYIHLLSCVEDLGNDLRIIQPAITTKEAMIGFNMALLLANKHLGSIRNS